MNIFTKDKISKVFLLYTIIIIGFMPLIVTPWINEPYYNGKVVFTIIITFLFTAYIAIIDVRLLLNKINTFTIFISISFILITISFLFSISKSTSFWGLLKNPEGYVIVLTYLVIFYLSYKFFKWSYLTFEIILIFSMIISLYGILQHLDIVPSVTSFIFASWEGPNSVYSTIGNRNFVGTYCTILMPIAITFWIHNNKKRGYIYISILFCFLLISQTRSAWISFVFYILIFFLFSTKTYNYKKHWLYLIIGITALCIILNYLSDNSILIRIIKLLNDFYSISSDTAGSNRMYYWKRSLHLLNDNPLFGSGPDTFGILFSNYAGNILIYFHKAHNEYLQIALTYGFPLLFIYIYLILYSLYKCTKNIFNSPIHQILFCCIFGYCLQANFSFSTIITSPALWILFGAAINPNIKTSFIYDKKSIH